MAWVTCETGDLMGRSHTDAYRRGAATVYCLNVGCLSEPPAPLLVELTPGDRQRADRYRQPADRLRFLYGRLLLRWVGYHLTGQPVPVIIGPYGKPDFPADSGWHVNLSHAGDWVLVAVDQHPVGVDVESYQSTLALDVLVPTACSRTEQAYVWASETPDAVFRQLWTRKEALLKAIGRGLVDTLAAVPALIGRTFIPAAIDSSDADWRVVGFDLDPAHPAALAYRFRDELPVVYQLTASDLLTYL